MTRPRGGGEASFEDVRLWGDAPTAVPGWYTETTVDPLPGIPRLAVLFVGEPMLLRPRDTLEGVPGTYTPGHDRLRCRRAAESICWPDLTAAARSAVAAKFGEVRERNNLDTEGRRA